LKILQAVVFNLSRQQDRDPQMPRLSTSEMRVLFDVIAALLILSTLGFATVLAIGFVAERNRKRCR
jgi:hypothetical protein